MHNSSCLSLSVRDWHGQAGGREACGPRGAVAQCAHIAVAQPVFHSGSLKVCVRPSWRRWSHWGDVHSLASWANLKVFQSEWTKKLGLHAMLL